jgi:hypothetical protein
MISRSPFAYQRRKQLRSLNWPTSRFSPSSLLIHQYPSPEGKSLGELIVGEGNPPPDRVVFNSWAPPETSEEEGAT